MWLVYTVLLYLATPFFIARLYIKSLKNKGYAQRISERFAYFAAPTQAIDIWIHAVSLGEVIAATPLIKQLQQTYPNKSFAVTSMTPTGSGRIIQAFADSVFHVYLPYDQPGAVDRFLTRLKPKLAIIMETELWPNLFYGCYKRNIPIIIANARLSPKSLQTYLKIKPLMTQLLHYVTLIAAQTKHDAQAYTRLGLDSNKIKITGSIKFDLTVADSLQQQGNELRKLWGQQRPVFIAASTHDGEDQQVLQAFKQIKQQLPSAVLLLVPRHPERFAKVAELSCAAGFNTTLRTDLTSEVSHLEVLIGNTIGEMMLFFAAADVAFIGGSLIAHGGHNVLEPAVIGIPVLTGPHVFNFAEINDLLTKAQGIITVHNAAELAAKVGELLLDPQLRKRYVANAALVVEQNKGALAQHLTMIASLLSLPVSR